ARGSDDPLDGQIALARRGGPDPHAHIGGSHLQRLAAAAGIDSDGPDAHPPRVADDAAGDLTTIGDEDGSEHQRRQAGLRFSRKPSTLSRPSKAARMRAIRREVWSIK